MTAADRPSVPRVGDTITNPDQLDALPVGVVMRARNDLLTETGRLGADGMRVVWGEGWSDHADAIEHHAPLTVLYVPGEPSRPSVTDDARAETTAALPRPGDGCQCTWHNEDRGGGHYELVAEYEPACPEHSEHVWNPRTGMWEHRAETTTATLMARRDGKTQALIESLLAQAEGRGLTVEVVYPETTTATTEDAVERVFQTTHPAPNTVMGWIRAGYEAGLRIRGGDPS